MNNRVLGTSLSVTMAALVTAAVAPQAGAETSEPATVEVRGGTAAFDAATNVSAVSIHGKSNALNARVRVRHAPEGMVLEQIDATLPVKSLNTGMGLRDEHMRKYVFTTPDGKVPDLHFSADKVACPAGHETTCQVSGNLTIRGSTRPFAIALKVREDGGQTFRAAGEGVVKLSAFGIEPPSQFGVKTLDEVKLHLEFTGKAGATTSASTGGAR